jgi:hypothetical protein
VVWGGAADPQESEIKSECPRLGVGEGRGVVNVKETLDLFRSWPEIAKLSAQAVPIWFHNPWTQSTFN